MADDPQPAVAAQLKLELQGAVGASGVMAQQAHITLIIKVPS